MSKPLSPIDMIDSGADDNEPVKEVTHGHLRQWHDMMADMHNLIERLGEDCNHWAADHTEQGERLREEIKTVDRIWSALGITTFEQAGGNAIWEIVSRHKSGLESIAKNACCDSCREAALVARAALDGPSLPNLTASTVSPSERT